jgi:hypothetical protein
MGRGASLNGVWWCGNLDSSFLLFKMMAERECRAVVCSWCCSLLILVGGSLNCWERLCEVLTYVTTRFRGTRKKIVSKVDK